MGLSSLFFLHRGRLTLDQWRVGERDIRGLRERDARGITQSRDHFQRGDFSDLFGNHWRIGLTGAHLWGVMRGRSCLHLNWGVVKVCMAQGMRELFWGKDLVVQQEIMRRGKTGTDGKFTSMRGEGGLGLGAENLALIIRSVIVGLH